MVVTKKSTKKKVAKKGTAAVTSVTTKWVPPPSCGHASDPYPLEDGTVIRITAKYDRKLRTVKPDFGVYFDGAWIPDCLALHIGWQDYGLPYPSIAEVLQAARMALGFAQEGKEVEIGCLGAHGRTGTFLAILDLLTMAEPSPSAAIERVRVRHCKKAIESREQEHYVTRVYEVLQGRDDPGNLVYPSLKAGSERKKSDDDDLNILLWWFESGDQLSFSELDELHNAGLITQEEYETEIPAKA